MMIIKECCLARCDTA